MHKKKAILIVTLISIVQFALFTCIGNAQSSCGDNANIISKAYNEGQWNKCKNLASEFIKSFPFEQVNLLSKGAEKKDPSSCYNYIPQIYYCLIKSCIRLNYPDTAKKYYSHAFNKGVKINFDSTDVDIVGKLGVDLIKKYSINPFLGFIPSRLDYKFGLAIGISRLLNLEIAFNKRNFIHNSGQQVGLLGRALKSDPGTYPGYIFNISGNNQFLDFACFTRKSVFRSRNDINTLYFSFGGYISYVLTSDVKSYEITKQKNMSNADSVARLVFNGRRYTGIDTLGVQMDLQNLYKNRLGYGVFAAYGSKTRLPKEWELFAELRFTLGKNYRYNYIPFRSFKPGLNYFSLNVGFTKNILK